MTQYKLACCDSCLTCPAHYQFTGHDTTYDPGYGERVIPTHMCKFTNTKIETLPDIPAWCPLPDFVAPLSQEEP